MPLVAGTVFYPGAIETPYSDRQRWRDWQYESYSPRTPIIFNPFLPAFDLPKSISTELFGVNRRWHYNPLAHAEYYAPVIPNPSPKGHGSIWVEGTDLRWVDQAGNEWSFTGTLYTNSSI